MKGKLRLRIFAHSWLSDWNHGNAHFLRGLVRELVRMGHEVRCYEEMGSWSLANLMQEGEIASRAIEQFRREFPELDVRFYQRDKTLGEMLEQELRDADVVIIHEWTDPDIASAVLSYKRDTDFARCFTTRIIALTPMQERSCDFRCIFSMACWRSASRSGASILTASAFHRRGRFMKQRMSLTSVRLMSHERWIFCGSATGATRSALAN